MRICTLTSSYDRSSSPFAPYDPVCNPSRWLPEHEWSAAAIHKATAVSQVRALVQSGVDIFVNLCDGAWDEDRAGIEVVQTLERLGAAFTGAGSAFYEPTRDAMKRVCHAAGIDTPGFAFVRTPDQALAAARALPFPLIVKHPNSYGSIAMGRDARVETADALVRRVRAMCAQFGEALIEEFVEGREFSVLVAEPGGGSGAPRAWPPAEVRFPPGETFKHFDLKWVDYGGMAWTAVADDALAARLTDASQRLFAGLAGSGYGRCDLRLGTDGRLVMLEINPNCGLFYPPSEPGSADCILGFVPDGHRQLLEHILDSARRRQSRSRPRWRVAWQPGRGYGLVAAMDLGEGEVIEPYEMRPQHLVSRAHVERRFTPEERGWFDRYAWPLTDDLFVAWSDRAEEWRPIDHSCDPSAWLDGLDLVARRAIAAGDAITIDYATFCGPAMAPFECRCGAPDCRGTIRPEDHLAPWLEARYGDHVSDYVRRRRRS